MPQVGEAERVGWPDGYTGWGMEATRALVGCHRRLAECCDDALKLSAIVGGLCGRLGQPMLVQVLCDGCELLFGQGALRDRPPVFLGEDGNEVFD